MIRIYPEQLNAQLREGLRACYLLLGNEPLLLQESQDAVKQAAQQRGFSEHFSVALDNTSDWEAIFSTCQALSLFASRQTLLLILPDNGPNAAMAEQLLTLSTLLHPDILLLLRGNKLTKAQENSAWFKAVTAHGVIVPCTTPEPAQLPRWITTRAKTMNLTLDQAAVQLLCYCYEGNLLALAQTLERLSLRWPDGKLTLLRVEQEVNDVAHFTPFHWVDALLAGKSKRALHILRQMATEGDEPVILIRTLQRDLLTLLTLQRQMAATPLRTLFDQRRIWQNRRPLFSEALQRLGRQQLAQAIHLLTQQEIALKQDYSQTLWPQLDTLSLLICNGAFPAGLSDV